MQVELVRKKEKEREEKEKEEEERGEEEMEEEVESACGTRNGRSSFDFHVVVLSSSGNIYSSEKPASSRTSFIRTRVNAL